MDDPSSADFVAVLRRRILHAHRRFCTLKREFVLVECKLRDAQDEYENCKRALLVEEKQIQDFRSRIARIKFKKREFPEILEQEELASMRSFHA